MRCSILVIVLVGVMIALTMEETQAMDDIEIWRQFTSTLKKGAFPEEKVRPYHESFREPLVGYLAQMNRSASWEEWEATPEIHRVDNQVHFLIPLSFDNQKDTYCFSFLVEDKNWYFQHMETITIRLDKMSPLPTSSFPDLPEGKKAWVREEIRVQREVDMFNFLAKEKGPEFAYDWLKDAPGYSLAAKAWVPFAPASKGFILYLCWEQSNLRGNKVTLVKLNDRQATVTMKPLYFELYKASGHLNQQISFEDYRKLFETMWYDRAINGGWEMTIEYKDEEVVFNFNRKT